MNNNLLFALKHPEMIWFRLESGEFLFGCNQTMYQSDWQKLAGCGPSVASNILLYQLRSGKIKLPIEVKTKSDMVSFMESVWLFLKPSSRGMFTLKPFCDGINQYLKSYGQEMRCVSLKISSHKDKRPVLKHVAGFIAVGLSNDCPVAFLNLSNGTISNIDDWHWLTVVALEQTDDQNKIFLELYDNSKAARIDLNEWLSTTRLGGGFIYLQEI